MSLFFASPRNQRRTKKIVITRGGLARDLLPNQHHKMYEE